MDRKDYGPLVIHSAPHPSGPVDHFGFPLDHPYVEQCLQPVLGPSSVAVLRRMPMLWQVAHPFETSFDEFGRALGLRAHNLSNTFDRLTKFGFASRPAPGELDVFTKCAPLTSRMQARLPRWLQDAHTRMLDDHLGRLVEEAGVGPPAGRAEAAHIDVERGGQLAPLTSELRQKPARELGR
jgi:hypothetical protein